MKRFLVLPFCFTLALLTGCNGSSDQDGPTKETQSQQDSSSTDIETNTDAETNTDKETSTDVEDNTDQESSTDQSDNTDKQDNTDQGSSSLVGTECDVEYDTNACENDQMLYCLFGTWVATSCENGTVCRSTNDLAPQCVATCQSGAADYSTCGQDSSATAEYGFDVYAQYTHSCLQATDGQYYVFTADLQLCDIDCDGDVCNKHSSEEGNTCDTEQYINKCSAEGYLVYCADDGTVHTGACNDGYTCQTAADTQLADCVTTCTNKDATTWTCDEAEYEITEGVVFGNMDIQYTFTCKKGLDGNYYDFYMGYKWCDTCSTDAVCPDSEY